MNLFWQHYLGNKKPTFLACIPEQVYATILESSKITIFFRTAKFTLAGSLKFPWHGFYKTANVRMKVRQAKMEGTYDIAYYQL